MIIYDPILTGSLNVNGTSLYSIESIDTVSGSVVDLTAASGSFSDRVSSNEASINSLNSASSSYLLNTTDTLDGDLTVTGKITAQEFHTEYTSASIVYQSGSTKFGDSADDVHEFTGNVGIGVNSPNSALEVDGNIYLSNNNNFLLFGTASNIDTYVQSDSTQNLYLGSRGASKLFVSSSGNVGIGTTDPSTTLDINGGYKWNGIARLTDLAYFVGSPTYGFRFNSAANDYNNVIFYDNGKAYFRSNVGIGTNTPQVRLDYGDDVNQAFHLYSSGADYYGINMTQYDSQAYSTNIFSGNGGLIKFRTASGTTTQSTRMTIAADGNVSIGTTTSTLFSTGWGRVLNVAATSGYATVQIAGSNGNGGEVDFGDASIRHGAIASLPGSHLAFYTNSTNSGDGVTHRMVILSNGNVGIGTTSPTEKLHIQGSANGNVKALIQNTNTGTNAYATLGFQSDENHPVQPAIFLNGANNTNYAGASSLNMYQFGNFPLGFVTSNTIRMIVTGAGNVGINTTSPGAKLHIVGSGENGAILFNNTGAQEHRFYSDTYTQFNAIGSSTPVWHWVQYTGVGVTPNYKMTLNNTGLGIGSTSPGYKLDVQGTMLATGTTRLATSSNSTVTIGDARNSQPASSDTKLILSGKNLEAGGTYYGDYGQILFNATSNYTGSAKKWLLTNGFDTYKFSIIMGGASQVTPTIGTAGAVSNGTPVLTIDDNGDVGIGSTNPSSTLDIQTNGSAGIARISADGNGAVYSANGDVQLYTNDAAYSTSIYSANKAGLLFRVQNDGNVGIGTTSPVRILHIENTTSIIHVQSTGLNENASIWFNSNVGGTQANRWEVGTNISAGASLEVYDRLNNQSRMVIKNDGNVGIGTSLPSYKLTVNGNMVALDANASIPTYSYFGLFTENGSLPGYPSNSFPTLKTDDTDMYFSTSGEYNAFLGWNASGYGYFGVKGPGANTIIRGGDGDNEFTGEVKRIGIGGGSYYIALSGNLSGYTANAFNAIKTNQSDLHFDVGGVYTGYINANGGFTDVSDASLKNNVEYITDALTIVSNLKGRKYNWIDENRGTDKQVGFIAQEVEEVLPEVVTEGAAGTKGVAYGKLTAVLVEAMKEQQAIIEDLKARIETLENS